MSYTEMDLQLTTEKKNNYTPMMKDREISFYEGSIVQKS